MIEVRNLEKSFGTHKILEGVSFCIDKGERAKAKGVEKPLIFPERSKSLQCAVTSRLPPIISRPRICPPYR